MPGTKCGTQRCGDPCGDSRLRITDLRARRLFSEPGAVFLDWSSALEAKGVWHKVFRNKLQVAVTQETSVLTAGLFGEDDFWEVIDVGPKSGDPAYDIAWAVAAVAGNKVRIDWDKVAGADAYAIYWDEGDGSIDYGEPYVVLPETGEATRSFTTPALANGTYKFVVRSRDAAGNETTNTTALTVVVASLPKAPTNLVAVYDSGTETVTLTWIDPPGIPGSGSINIYVTEVVLADEWDQNIGSWPAIDYSAPDDSADIGDETKDIQMSGGGPRIIVIALRAEDDILGFEEQNVDCVVRVETDVDEEETTSRPARAEHVVAEAIAGAKIRVSGIVPPVPGMAEPTGGYIWYDTVEANVLAGSGTPVAVTLTAIGEGWHFSYDTPALVDGTPYFFLFRAGAGTSGAAPWAPFEDEDVVSATADSTAPAVPGNQAAVAVRGGEG